MPNLRRSLERLFGLVQLRPVIPLLLIALGVATALAEVFSITLIIPLVQMETGQATAVALPPWLAHWPSEQRLAAGGLLILVGILLRNLLAFAYSVLSQWMIADRSDGLRKRLADHLLRVGLGWIERQQQGRLANLLNKEPWRVSSAVGLVTNFLINLCMTLIFGGALLWISWPLTLVAGVAFLILSYLLRRLTRRIKALGAEAHDADNQLSQRVLEILGGLRVIHASGTAASESTRFADVSGRVRQTFFQMERLCGAVGPVSEIFSALLLAAILGAALVGGGESLASTLAFLLLLYRLHPRIKQMDFDRVSFAGLEPAIDALHDFLDPEGKGIPASGFRQPAVLREGIRFESVGFRYESGAPPVFSGLDLLLPAGKTTALVGPSGAGKSTLASLICRFYEPERGRILADTTPLSEFDLVSWRSRIALVSQEVFLFHATVAENIAYGVPGASAAEIEVAARASCAWDFIQGLPQGLETVLGDRGVRISGGQRQRLALARALIRQAQILILDEATNALDAITEGEIRGVLRTATAGRTVIVIAHRLHTIEDADHVVVLEEGRVVQAGPPAQLLADPGLYRRLQEAAGSASGIS